MFPKLFDRIDLKQRAFVYSKRPLIPVLFTIKKSVVFSERQVICKANEVFRILRVFSLGLECFTSY